MNCHRVSSLVSAHIDGELTGVEMLQIREHLGGCQSCTEEYETMRATKQMLARLQYAQPRAGFADSLRARLDEVRVPAYQRLLNRVLAYGHNRVRPVAVASTVICACLVVLLAHPGTNQLRVADNPPPYGIQAINMPEGAMISFERFVSERKRSHPLIPEPTPAAPATSGMFSFASFIGNN